MILVTGGAGYIGSHCVMALLERKCDVIVFDNLSTGHHQTIDELKKYGSLSFYQGDLKDYSSINELLKSNKIEAVLHFAASSQVNESIQNPQKYYLNNVCGTINLLGAMVENNINKIVFSSTAAIYGEPEYLPIDENHPLNPINPYGQTKLIVEKIMDDYDKAYGLKSVRLRYFNVVGADSKCRIGEWHDSETHLIPNILKSTFNNSKTFELYGNDYETKDGTCVRDYINIEDLISAHLLALDYLNNGGETNYFNLGTNNGNTVKEVFAVCEEITGKKIPLTQKPKRAGDPAILIADNKKAKAILGWESKKHLAESIMTAYNWERFMNKNLEMTVLES